jgi:RNA polymerase sigma-70 factor (ECF subfamily)
MSDPMLAPTPPAADPSHLPAEPTPSSDEALLARIRGGELSAFEGLFARHARAVYDFFFYMTCSREQAIRLSQEAWLAVAKQREDPDAEARFLPWLFGRVAQVRRTLSPAAVADMAAADRKSLAGASAPALPAGAELPITAARETAAPVQQTLAAMAESYREVLVLHRLSGLSFADVAVALGATEAAVKARALQGYVLLSESRRGDPPAAEAGGRSAAPLPLSRCPETEKLINLVVASPESRAREPLAALVQHTHDCPLCEVTAEQLGAGRRALDQIAALSRPEPAALEQIARAVLPAVAAELKPQGGGWALALAAVALLLVAVTIAGMVFR